MWTQCMCWRLGHTRRNATSITIVSARCTTTLVGERIWAEERGMTAESVSRFKCNFASEKPARQLLVSLAMGGAFA
jgi:hypothetical protein